MNKCKQDTIYCRTDCSLSSSQGKCSDISFIKENSVRLATKQGKGPFADIVVFKSKEINRNPMSILHKTCQLNKVKFRNRSTIRDGKQ